MSYLKPKQLLENNPGLKKFWTPRDLGYMLMLGLVRGEQQRRTCLVEEKDVMKMYRLRLQIQPEG